MGRRGLSLYDPSGRVSARRPAFVLPEQRDTPQAAPKSALAAAKQRQKDQIGSSGSKDEKGLGEKFFGTAVGSGLGKVINNPVVKSILQPLDVFGIPQRVIASTINEVADVFAGEGFSPKDWIDQVNPDAWLDGNMEGSIGMGDVWQKHGKALGA